MSSQLPQFVPGPCQSLRDTFGPGALVADVACAYRGLHGMERNVRRVLLRRASPRAHARGAQHDNERVRVLVVCRDQRVGDNDGRAKGMVRPDPLPCAASGRLTRIMVC